MEDTINGLEAMEQGASEERDKNEEEQKRQRHLEVMRRYYHRNREKFLVRTKRSYRERRKPKESYVSISWYDPPFRLIF